MKFKITPWITLIVLHIIYINTNAQAPNLRSASSYMLFTGTGSIVNNGNTVITGDVGDDEGPISGFPPGIINGDLNMANSLTATAKTDVGTAYTELNSLTCDTTIGTTLGNNQTLTPGIYCLTAASSLVGTLILDGLNDPTSVFVFKIGGAFSTAALSQISLINSASVCNVYWSVDGAFETGDSAIFKGTMIGDGQITLGLGTDLEGRALTRAGMISIDSSTGFLPSSCVFLVPIELISFNGNYSGNNRTELFWSTASETNNDYFTIEESNDNIHFNILAEIGGAGNADNTNKYFYSDINVISQIKYYRLTQTDFDGKVNYLKTIELINFNSDKTKSIVLYPNPHKRFLFIEITDVNAFNSCELTILNAQGKTVFETTLTQKHNKIEPNLKTGLYYYIIKKSNNTYESGQILVE